MKIIRILLVFLVATIALSASGIVDVGSIIHVPESIQAFLHSSDNLHYAMGLVVGDIVTEYGAYYEKAGQNKNRLRNLLLQPSITEGHMTPIKTDDTVFKLANGVISDIVQPFHKNFTKKGDQTFTPNEIPLYHLKVDLELYPDDIEANWLGFLASNNLSRKEWPVVRYILENMVIPKIKDNIELKEIVKGVYAAPNGSVAGATGTSMDGLKKQLQAAVDAGTANQVPLNTITTSNIFDEIETFVDSISEVYRGVAMNVFMSPTYYRWYMRDARSQGFYTISGDKDVNNRVDFTPQNVIGLPSMGNETFIFATPKENLLHITKKSINKTTFKVEESKRVVSVLTDWYESVGFGIQEAVWTSLPATV